MSKILLKKKSSGGFTLAELMMAMLMAGIVFSAASVIMAFGQKSLDREWERTAIQRDAVRVMQFIKHNVRGASTARAIAGGKILMVYKDNRWMIIKYEENAKSIRCLSQKSEPDDKIVSGEEGIASPDEWSLVEGLVESASFSIDPASASTVIVDFTLKDREYNASAKSSVTMRNSAAKI